MNTPNFHPFRSEWYESVKISFFYKISSFQVIPIQSMKQPAVISPFNSQKLTTCTFDISSGTINSPQW